MKLVSEQNKKQKSETPDLGNQINTLTEVIKSTVSVALICECFYRIILVFLPEINLQICERLCI